jgi:hypothetical protein
VALPARVDQAHERAGDDQLQRGLVRNSGLDLFAVGGGATSDASRSRHECRTCYPHPGG